MTGHQHHHTPLAEQLRPKNFSEVLGQDEALNLDGPLIKSIQAKRPISLIFWGPPGSGKTTLSELYAKEFHSHFQKLSAVFSGVNDLKKILHSSDPLFSSGPIILFVDEIHRFNKSQQDAFLSHLESGELILIGATTENPSFYLNNALLSRVRVIKLNFLSDEALEMMIQNYEKKFRPLQISHDERKQLILKAQGDGRYLYNLLEDLEIGHNPKHLLKRGAHFDRGDDQHYNLISALHKAVRGSDPDAALYWFSRMLEGGESPLFLARRLIRMSSEDIGLADPEALKLAVSAKEAYELLGSPEGELCLAQVVVYLALAPKSNALYTAFKQAKKMAEETTHLEPPNIILNAPTKLMQDLGYGENYIYDHDAPGGVSGQNYFPSALPSRPQFYSPKEVGFEREMIKRLQYFNNFRQLKRT